MISGRYSYPDANDCDSLRTDPAFKMAVGRPPESGVVRAARSRYSAGRLKVPPLRFALVSPGRAFVSIVDSCQQRGGWVQSVCPRGNVDYGNHLRLPD
jgi:hypothetical protein